MCEVGEVAVWYSDSGPEILNSSPTLVEIFHLPTQL